MFTLIKWIFIWQSKLYLFNIIMIFYLDGLIMGVLLEWNKLKMN